MLNNLSLAEGLRAFQKIQPVKEWRRTTVRMKSPVITPLSAEIRT
jgi:hypothetical protein